jgi:ABC-type transport system substrate-binding protein
MNYKYIFITFIYIGVFFTQTLKYAEEYPIGHSYPYKDYPPERQTVRYFSLTHQYLLKDDAKSLLPSSNIIDLAGSSINGNIFSLIMMSGWSFNSVDPDKVREVIPNDIIYSIDEAKYLKILNKFNINMASMRAESSNKIIITTNKQILTESDSLDIINALRRVILVPAGSGNNMRIFSNYPIGAGPFYESNRGAFEISLSSTETEDYYFGDPKLRDINIQTALKFVQGTMLLSQEIDIMIEGNIFDIIQFGDNSNFRIEQVGSDFLNLLVINHESRKMQSRKFREALALAIDKEAFEDELKATMLHGPLSAANDFHNVNIVPRGYDPDKAKDLLESLGYYLDDTGYFQDPATGAPINLRFMYYRNENDVVINMIEDYIRKIGIRNIEMMALSNPTIDDILGNNNSVTWDLYFRTEKIKSNQFLRTYFHSDEISKNPNNNWGKYRNNSIDLLFDSFQFSDGTNKMLIGQQIHEELYKDVAIIGLFISPTWAIYHSYVEPNIVPWYFFNKPHEWTVK